MRGNDKSLEAAERPVSRAILELAQRALVDASEWNEGEPCWCPLWWWEEQTGPSEGAHTEHCDQQRALFVEVEEALHAVSVPVDGEPGA